MTSTGLPSAIPIQPQTTNSTPPEIPQLPRLIRIENKDMSPMGKNNEISSNKNEYKTRAVSMENKPVPALARMSKRSSSASNDLLYERDRFKARLQTLNTKGNNIQKANEHEDVIDSDNCSVVDENCEVCDGIIGTKTTKLNVESDQEYMKSYESEVGLSPLDSGSKFYKEDLRKVQLLEGIHTKILIKSITYGQLQYVFNWYFNRPLPPTKEMFPWLHGIHKENFAQRQYFISQQNGYSLGSFDQARPSSARFLMCINSSSDSLSGMPLLKNTVKLNEILQPIDISKAEVSDLILDIVNKIFIDEDKKTLDELLKIFCGDCMSIGHLPFFLDLDPDSGVSLRNFHIQVAKLAICSDFVVYCFHKDHSTDGCRCGAISRIMWLTQIYSAYRDGQKESTYKVFVPDDVQFIDNIILNEMEYTKFEGLFTFKPNNALLASSLDSNKKTQLNFKLDAFKSNTLSIWDNDYQIKEKIETTRMSAATKINKNVWVGNIWDHQIMLFQLLRSSESLEVIFDTSGAAKDIYCDPNNSIITKDTTKSNDIFSYLPKPKANWRLFIHCHNDASFPDLPTLSSLLFKYTISTHHSIDQEFHTLEFPPSGSIGLGDCRKDALMSIVNTCKLLYLYSSSTSYDTDVLSSLIYCSDGYTELSLLVLCYLMYSKNIELDQAILDLHLDYGRPFYIFNTDVTILKKLQTILNKFSPHSLGSSINWRELETITNQELNELFLPQRSRPNQPIASNLRLGYIVNDSDSDSTSDEGDDDSDWDDEFCSPTDWVKDVEGSIPSRILPYLYLGSLKHANSLPLLSKLGIKKVISVGEPLYWLNGYRFQKNNNVSIDELDGGNIEKYNITPSNSQSNGCCVDTVLKVNNLQDDGIDELSASLPSILRYIDNEYKKSNGKTKILVHCRVGVSRSATVVIAEVMKRLNISLPKAYLYVRVRRLNIIVQPNLRFMYELFKWEEEEKRKMLQNNESDTNVENTQDTLREIDWFVMCREIMNLNLPYLVK
ncbi:uncharacterized protein AC631_00909 [Debaryomyces fabryi]|uniref:Uncharacterized protein n=1 Tax=Debaryomyces fabryi TaxID=58627 RepID=A0A0V1Q477_9ASCO|nr:uncharacterized protein AC631_00909 [Debaryomyces fabryi]KSA03271.1 hypothetical protein AC631_00909 [Debaryomyces fabryi]CUM45096.1 unnamed protein product [Debaryomyces fabryi]